MVTVLYLWESFGDVSMPKLQFWEEEICCQNADHNMGKCSEVAGLKSGAASAPWRNSSLHFPRLCKLSLRPEGSKRILLLRPSHYLTRPDCGKWVILKPSPVFLHHEGCSLGTFGLLDNGSEHSVLPLLAPKKIFLCRCAEEAFTASLG